MNSLHKMRYIYRFSVFFFLLCASDISAQVTIGSDIQAEQGALLDLKENLDRSSKKGLGLPRVELKNIRTETDLAKTMGASVGLYDASEHIGLVVYNTGKNEESLATRFCPGVHVWTGTYWKPLIPYPSPVETRTLQLSIFKNFNHLTNPSDPAWASLGKNAANYPLGYIGTFTDKRPNDTQQVYHYSRFYVGYKVTDNRYSVTRNFSCDQDPSKTTTKIEVIEEKTFEDGVWMSENLRAIVMPDGASITYSNNASKTDSRYYYPNVTADTRPTSGVLYNWTAAINMGSGSGQTPAPGPGSNELNKIQGICPPGWHLPSDRQWTDLENGVIINTSKFSTTTDIGVSNILTYENITTTNTWRGSNHGQALKSTTTVESLVPSTVLGAIPQPTGGTSKTILQGGFNVLLAGDAAEDGYVIPANYGLNAYFWTANSFDADNAWIRHLNYGRTNVDRANYTRSHLFSVRCMKD